MSECGGLEAILFRLNSLQNPMHSINLFSVSLKLISYCVKLQVIQIILLSSSLIHIIFNVLFFFILHFVCYYFNIYLF